MHKETRSCDNYLSDIYFCNEAVLFNKLHNEKFALFKRCISRWTNIAYNKGSLFQLAWKRSMLWMIKICTDLSDEYAFQHEWHRSVNSITFDFKDEMAKRWSQNDSTYLPLNYSVPSQHQGITSVHASYRWRDGTSSTMFESSSTRRSASSRSRRSCSSCCFLQRQMWWPQT